MRADDHLPAFALKVQNPQPASDQLVDFVVGVDLMGLRPVQGARPVGCDLNEIGKEPVASCFMDGLQVLEIVEQTANERAVTLGLDDGSHAKLGVLDRQDFQDINS